MKAAVKSKNLWYTSGLHFECTQCGGCCSGPVEGYIWVTRPEIQFIAEYLKIPVRELREKYLKRVGVRLSIIEDKSTRDCIFLDKVGDEKMGHHVGYPTVGCRIYPVRPNQCRTWPFWQSNLASSDSWNQAAKRCAGINRGRLYSFDQIEKIRTGKKWWENEDGTD